MGREEVGSQGTIDGQAEVVFGFLESTESVGDGEAALFV